MYVVDGENVAHKRPITLGIAFDECSRFSRVSNREAIIRMGLQSVRPEYKGDSGRGCDERQRDKDAAERALESDYDPQTISVDVSGDSPTSVSGMRLIMFSKFFIDRPRFAMVIAVVLALAGVIAAFNLRDTVSHVAPPSHRLGDLSRSRRGDAGQHGGIPLEEAINGVDDMINMVPRRATPALFPDITFKTGGHGHGAREGAKPRPAGHASLPGEVTSRGTHRGSFFGHSGISRHHLPTKTRDALFWRTTPTTTFETL